MMGNRGSILEVEEVKQFLQEIIGEDGLKVLHQLLKSDATDEELSAETGIHIKTVRRTLYKLHEHGIASYTRRIDEEAGAHSYTWSPDPEMIHQVVEKKKAEALEELKRKLDYEKNNMYFECRKDGIRIPFEIVYENGFRCLHCGGKVEAIDNQGALTTLEEEIAKLKRESQK